MPIQGRFCQGNHRLQLHYDKAMVLSAMSPGDDLQLGLAIRLRSESVRRDF